MNTLLLDNLLGYLFSFPGNIFGTIILILDIIALYSIWNDKSMSGSSKILWSALIFFLPLLGLILWFMFGKESK